MLEFNAVTVGCALETNLPIALLIELTVFSTFEIRVAFDVILALLDSMPLTAVELTLLITDAFELIPLINEELTVLMLLVNDELTLLILLASEELTLLNEEFTLLMADAFELIPLVKEELTLLMLLVNEELTLLNEEFILLIADALELMPLVKEELTLLTTLATAVLNTVTELVIVLLAVLNVLAVALVNDPTLTASVGATPDATFVILFPPLSKPLVVNFTLEIVTPLPVTTVLFVPSDTVTLLAITLLAVT